MHARALVVLTAIPIALATAPAVAPAQRAVRDCSSYAEWRDWDACIRRRDGTSSDHRSSAIAHSAARLAAAASRRETQALARERTRIDRADRDRIRADTRDATRAAERRARYTRWW
jgi:hypothetical protein